MERTQTPRIWRKMSLRFVVPFVMAIALADVFRNFLEMRYVSRFGDTEIGARADLRSATPAINPTKTTIAYAVSVTHFEVFEENEDGSRLIDRAAVFHQSIKLAMKKSRRYDYHLYAFVHPDAVDAKPWLEQLGYRVQVRDTPFNISNISNAELIEAQGNGCCQEREYLKLYTYLLSDYPVAIHMDLDTIVLRPMDALFDVMTATASNDAIESFAQTATMWLNNTRNNVEFTHASKSVLDTPGNINFMFTRDYNMVDPTDPPWKHPYQMGVQGGFLVIRPNQRDFDRMIEIILTGGNGYTIGNGWGGPKLEYGGYYGAGTIQGLASFYYDYHENATRSVELNRCKYNTMVDHPLHYDKEIKKKLCRTNEKKCEDCRKTSLKDIYTAHFTICGKPEWCPIFESKKDRLCSLLMREWYKARFSLELEWMNRFSSAKKNDDPTSLYVPRLHGLEPDKSKRNIGESDNMGYCDGDNRYIPLQLPVMTETNSQNDWDTLI